MECVYFRQAASLKWEVLLYQNTPLHHFLGFLRGQRNILPHSKHQAALETKQLTNPLDSDRDQRNCHQIYPSVRWFSSGWNCWKRFLLKILVFQFYTTSLHKKRFFLPSIISAFSHNLWHLSCLRPINERKISSQTDTTLRDDRHLCLAPFNTLYLICNTSNFTTSTMY